MRSSQLAATSTCQETESNWVDNNNKRLQIVRRRQLNFISVLKVGVYKFCDAVKGIF